MAIWLLFYGIDSVYFFLLIYRLFQTYAKQRLTLDYTLNARFNERNF